jgi:cobalt/nickel transport protein
MQFTTRPVLALALCGLLAASAHGHFNMLLPDKPSAKRGESVTLTYQWGHPFEHELFDAPAPQSVIVVGPRGKAQSLTPGLQRGTAPAAEGAKVAVYRLAFTPEERGDFVLVLKSAPIWMEEDQEFLQDSVKVVLHVQAQKGWDNLAGKPLEMAPLTRPYGLQPGLAFQAQVLADGKPLAGTLVEVEHYHPAPPKELPPDEQVTRTAKTDPNGVVTATLTEPGWWCLAAARDAGTREHDGKAFPVRQRSILWVFVDEKPAPRPPQ